MYCTAPGIEPIFCNCKWSVTFKNYIKNLKIKKKALPYNPAPPQKKKNGRGVDQEGLAVGLSGQGCPDHQLPVEGPLWHRCSPGSLRAAGEADGTEQPSPPAPPHPRGSPRFKPQLCSVTLAGVQLPLGLGFPRCKKGGWGKVMSAHSVAPRNPMEGDFLPAPHPGSSG